MLLARGSYTTTSERKNFGLGAKLRHHFAHSFARLDSLKRDIKSGCFQLDFGVHTDIVGGNLFALFILT